MGQATVVLLLLFVTTCLARNLIVGTSYNTQLAWQTRAEYMAIPFKKRVKEVFYADPSNRLIRGIVIRDVEHTDGSASLTAGGVGFSYTNIRLKSTRGGGLNYQIEIYV